MLNSEFYDMCTNVLMYSCVHMQLNLPLYVIIYFIERKWFINLQISNFVLSNILYFHIHCL